MRELSHHVYTDVDTEKFKLSFGFSNAAGVRVDRNSRNYGYSVIGQFRTFYSWVGWRTSTTLTWRVSDHFVELNQQLPEVFFLDQTPQHLDWRYIHKPEASYTILDMLDGKNIVTQVILKQNKSSVNIFKLVWNKKLEDPKVMQQVISTIKDYVAQSYRLVSMMVIENAFWKKVLKDGWWPRLTQQQFFLTVKPHSALPAKKVDVLNVDEWRVMGGDLL